MDDQRIIAIDVYPFTVELSTDDFEYLLAAALDHQDEFFENLIMNYVHIKEKQDEESAKG